ncbi:TPA: hemolysin activation protein [Escherichia coli]|uniref:Hha/YmoA family nucleoid-associated regulatory protein n=1 Tax=Escherichia coli TaxID=562 RepID=UPI000B428259|nr:Hha/YmoA family nucleoid-associated regulatory protein [Escherichia coli]EFF1837827.1 hemolysin activation protein [Escherichia coli]EFH5761973.1 hemolysin activation protein [Escherichia coli]EFK2301990.1 hemolysin activation protein [Escherichia coli]EFN6150202.1 hemolysin activation protein [Escherichia coli]EFN6175535.1 hemolysin activation protein [Escherichia coli]
MEVKTKEDWLYQFRRCSSRETLEKVISHTRYKLTPAEMEAFNSAVDHRLAELTMNKLYDHYFLCGARGVVNLHVSA